MEIAVIGLWHLGGVVAAGLAELGHSVIGIDEDQEVITGFKAGQPVVAEPDLSALLQKYLPAGQLQFSDTYQAIGDCQAVFFTIDTPVTEQDEPDMTSLFTVAQKLAPFIKSDALFVVMSQVPVGSTAKLTKIIKEKNPDWQGAAVYFPENLQLGQAVRCFLQPDRLVIGADRPEASANLESIIKPINCPRLLMNVASAEMSKHALNAFLATSLSFTYNISDLCEQAGADVTDVMTALRADKRIGQAAYLDSSLGFSGGTLMRDLKSLSAFGKNYQCPLPVIEGVIKSNEARCGRVVENLRRRLPSSLSQQKIGILGVTYKPGTSTLRRSLALELIKLLSGVAAEITAFDPAAGCEEFTESTGLTLAADPYQMSVGCNALILVTAWPEFTHLDFARLKGVMQAPYLFFDTRNMFKDREGEIRSLGIRYQGLGR